MYRRAYICGKYEKIICGKYKEICRKYEEVCTNYGEVQGAPPTLHVNVTFGGTSVGLGEILSSPLI